MTQPGVVPIADDLGTYGTGTGGSNGIGGISIAGGRGDAVTYLLDGGINNRVTSNQVVFNPNPEAVEEFRLFHRKDGKDVKEGDDLMSATRYAIMMLRFASTKETFDSFRRKLVYPKIGIA